MPRTGRPKLKIKADQVSQLAAIGLNVNEIGAIVGCSPDTLTRRFQSQMQTGWERMKASIKRTQYEVGVNKKNPTMLIWLGKQHLGQSDVPQKSSNQSNQQLEGFFQALMAGPAVKKSNGEEGSGGAKEQ
jgi:hypothetical protein